MPSVVRNALPVYITLNDFHYLSPYHDRLDMIESNSRGTPKLYKLYVIENNVKFQVVMCGILNWCIMQHDNVTISCYLVLCYKIIIIKF